MIQLWAIVLCTGINGLGAVRALARKGICVVAIHFDAHSPAQFSSLPHAQHHVYDSNDQAVLELLESYAHKRPVVLSCSDQHAELLARYRERLEVRGLYVSGPPGRVAASLNDKAREIELMREMSVTTPRSITNLCISVKAIIETLGLPVIIKPRSYAHHSLLNVKNIIASTHEQLQEFVTAHSVNLEAFVAQEVIPGPDESLWVCNCCFGNDHELLTAFTFQRMRTSPPHFGVTSFAVGVNNETVKRRCAVIGKTLAYTGAAMIEFKFDARRGEYVYIESNPRSGMCNTFDTHSNVNNVYTAFQVARGEDPRPTPSYQLDAVIFANVYADFTSRLSDGESVVAIFKSYMNTWRAPHAWAYFDALDPWPFVHAFSESFAAMVRAIGRRCLRQLAR